MLQEPLRFTCLEFDGRLGQEEAETCPLLMNGVDELGEEKSLVVKLRNPDAKRGHFGPTSLTCELLSAAIARAVNLRVPDYTIATIPKDILSGVPRQWRELIVNNLGENFGSVYIPGLPTWQPTSRRPPVDFMTALEGVLTFDAILMNGDRKERKSNIITAGDRPYVLDHSLAIPVRYWPAGEYPLFPDSEVSQHCAYSVLRSQGREYEWLTAEWMENVRRADLDRFRRLIPVQWESQPGEIDRIFDFVIHRGSQFKEISSALRRVLR